jgi:signal transduction histidine kinase
VRIRWASFDAILDEFSEGGPRDEGFFLEDREGVIRAGEGLAHLPPTARHRLSSGEVEVGRLNVVGSPSAERVRLCWAACERELAHQITVADMADATARLWRQTNALMRMSAATNLALEPGFMFERVLGGLAHSTNFRKGVGVVRLAGGETPVAIGSDGAAAIPADPEVCSVLLGLDDDVRLVGEAQEDAGLRAAVAGVVGEAGPAAVALLATETDRYGALVAPVEDLDIVTSEDLKMLGAAAQILSIATENGHTLLREREATRLAVENELLNAQARDMEEMLHVVAHDLRSPMTAMYGFMHVSLDAAGELLGILEEEGGDEDLLARGALIEKPLEDGIRSVEKLNRMVQRLLDFSRVARLDYQFEEVDLRALVDVVFSSLRFQLEEKGIEIEILDLPWVLGDRVQLEAVFGNLVDNAIKYMGGGDRRRIAVGSVEKGKERIFFVRDTGIGMTPDQVAKAFLPFRRFHADAAPGEGIGLSYVRKIVERHGGRIWCESEQGVGTTFCFTIGLPVAAPG